MRCLNASDAITYEHEVAWAYEQSPLYISYEDIERAKQEAIQKNDCLLLDKKISGLYIIYNKVRDAIYIGRSVDIRSRIGTHMSGLRNRNHINWLMSRDFDQDGEDAFCTAVLSYVHKDHCFVSELYALQSLRSAGDLSYNIHGSEYSKKAKIEINFEKMLGDVDPKTIRGNEWVQEQMKQRQSLIDAGLEEVRGIWAKPDHHAPIKQFADSLKRAGEGKK